MHTIKKKTLGVKCYALENRHKKAASKIISKQLFQCFDVELISNNPSRRI